MTAEELKQSELFLRPRFVLNTSQKPDKVLEVLLKNIETSNTNYKVKVSNNHVFIDVADKEAHYWSPQLHFKVVDEEGNTQIKGLFGPKPAVWTLFMFIHFAVAIAFISFSILFYVHYKLGGNVVFPVVMMVALPIVWFLLYFAGQIGKETGKEQMNGLKKYMKSLLVGAF